MCSSVSISDISQALAALEKERAIAGERIRQYVEDMMRLQRQLSVAVDQRDAIDKRSRELIRIAHEDGYFYTKG